MTARERCLSAGSVRRYVVTKLDTSSTAKRTLFDAAQGQYTYPTAAEAQKRADAFRSDRHCAEMDLQVRPVECMPMSAGSAAVTTFSYRYGSKTSTSGWARDCRTCRRSRARRDIQNG